MISKRIHIAVPVLALILVVTPLVVPNALALGYSFNPVPARATETSVNSATAVDLALNVSGASIGTNYQFAWQVTDPSGAFKNQHNATTATATSFQLTLLYPRDFGVNMILAGTYSVIINQMQPTGATNPVATGAFTIGLTDKLVYQRGNTVLIKAAGYGNGEKVNINIIQGSTSYPSSTNADTAGDVSASWLVPSNEQMGTWTVSLIGSMTTKTPPDTQTFVINPNVTLSALNLGQAIVQRVQAESVTFTANYPNGSKVQMGSARVRLTNPVGQSVFTNAIYNSTAAAFEGTYTVPPGARTGGWVVAVDSGMFNDSYGNIGPASSDFKSFTVWSSNVTIGQLSVSQSNIERSQTQMFSFTASYPNGVSVQTGTGTIRITETDGTTSYTAVANYNATAGLFQASSKIPASSQTGAWVASLDPGSFNDGFGNGGPMLSVVRGFTVQSAVLKIVSAVSNQTYTVGEVIPIYASATYSDGSLMTNGTITVSFTVGGTQTGKPVTLMFIQGQSRWAGSYTVSSTDLSGLWVAIISASDSSGNSGQQIQSLIVSVPSGQAPSTEPLNLYWFFLAALVIGSGGSGLMLLRRFNLGEGSFDQLFNMIGGEFSPATTLMVLGDAGSGTTTLGLELIHHHLSAGKPAGLLAYDAFPQEIQRNMKSFGWDVSDNLKNGSFKILDCYSALAGVENSLIRDPVDFTEISIRVTQMMDTVGRGPYLLVFDSLAPVFNGVKAETTINFLRVLSAKIKNNGGILVLLGSQGAIPSQVKSSLENIVDSEIELNVAREGGKLVRLLTIRRLSGRMISPVPAEFEIVSGKGILFRKPRIPIGILTPKKKASQF